jgi:hypothetical protein
VPRDDSRATTPGCDESAVRRAARSQAASKLAAPQRCDDAFAGDAFTGSELAIGLLERSMQTSAIRIVQVVLDRCKVNLGPLRQVGGFVEKKPAVPDVCPHGRHIGIIAGSYSGAAPRVRVSPVSPLSGVVVWTVGTRILAPSPSRSANATRSVSSDACQGTSRHCVFPLNVRGTVRGNSGAARDTLFFPCETVRGSRGTVRDTLFFPANSSRDNARQRGTISGQLGTPLFLASGHSRDNAGQLQGSLGQLVRRDPAHLRLVELGTAVALGACIA